MLSKDQKIHILANYENFDLEVLIELDKLIIQYETDIYNLHKDLQSSTISEIEQAEKELETNPEILKNLKTLKQEIQTALPDLLNPPENSPTNPPPIDKPPSLTP